MNSRVVFRNDRIPTAVGTVAVLAALVAFTGMTPRTTVPIAVMLFAVMGHDVADDEYDLPDGTNVIAYGASVAVAGTFLALLGPSPWIGGLLALAGLWFVLDGATTVRYGDARPDTGYVPDDTDTGEAMLRLQTLSVVYRALRDAPEPKTTAALAADLDLTESRVADALEFLERRGRVERAGGGYRAEPSRWGRLEPAARFLAWLPRRMLRPFGRIAANV